MTTAWESGSLKLTPPRYLKALGTLSSNAKVRRKICTRCFWQGAVVALAGCCRFVWLSCAGCCCRVPSQGAVAGCVKELCRLPLRSMLLQVPLPACAVAGLRCLEVRREESSVGAAAQGAVEGAAGDCEREELRRMLLQNAVIGCCRRAGRLLQVFLPLRTAYSCCFFLLFRAGKYYVCCAHICCALFWLGLGNHHALVAPHGLDASQRSTNPFGDYSVIVCYGFGHGTCNYVTVA